MIASNWDRADKATSHCLIVAIPCICSIVFILFLVGENLLWRVFSYYPPALAVERYVSDYQLLTAESIKTICGTVLTKPELIQKENGLFLRCGTPGLEGVWRIRLSDN